MHIQKIFVIIAFNEILIDKAVEILGKIPILGNYTQGPFKTFLQNQKDKLHRGNSNVHQAKGGSNPLSNIFEMFVVGMIVYFVISIVNSLAQSYHKRIHKKTGKIYRKVAKD